MSSSTQIPKRRERKIDMEGNSSSSSSSSSFYKCRLCKVTLLFLGFIWFLLIGVVDSTRTVPPPTPPAAVSSGFRGPGVINRDGQRSSSHRNKDHHKKMERLKFVSKRRVPNGPDPIHNRLHMFFICYNSGLFNL